MNHLLQKVKLDQLAERIVLNDVKAETDFYNYVYFNLLLKVKKIIKNHQDAEEITLDIINNVIKRIKEEKIDNLESYLMGTTKKMSFKFLRDKNAQKRGGGISHFSLDDEYMTFKKKPEHNFQYEDYYYKDDDLKNKEKFNCYIDRIKRKQLRLVTRLKVEELNYDEIERVLDSSQNDVKYYFYTGYKKLIEKYENIKDKLNSIPNIDKRLEDFNLFLKNWQKDYTYLNNELPSSIILLKNVILDNFLYNQNELTMPFIAKVQCFLLEILVNKGQIRGEGGALSYVQSVFDKFVHLNDINGQIQTKFSELVAYRIVDEYENALKVAQQIEAMAGNVMNNSVRQQYLSRIKNERGRTLSDANYPKEADRFLQEANIYFNNSDDIERPIVVTMELADNYIKLKQYDKAYDLLNSISKNIPEKFLNGYVKYYKILSNLYFATNNYQTAYCYIKNAWDLTNTGGLINQFNDLFYIFKNYNVNPGQVLCKDEIEKGQSIIKAQQFL